MFLAKYDGYCRSDDCDYGDRKIRAGDECAYFNDDIMHATCVNREKDRVKDLTRSRSSQSIDSTLRQHVSSCVESSTHVGSCQGVDTKRDPLLCSKCFQYHNGECL